MIVCFISDKYARNQLTLLDVIVSMTRTERVGFLRDIRRVTVALSRARLGLYILGRQELLKTCYELKPVLRRLFARPNKLCVVTGELFPTSRPLEADCPTVEIENVEHLGQYVYEMSQAKIASLKETVAPIMPPEDVLQAPTVVEEDEDDLMSDESLEKGEQ